ncbi:macro domain-containing protein [Funiculus sociatus]|uniref:macro domain-containing protein n=1 Tax=Funiculus sociatus TaxID=450527 RepID=UPI003D64B68B
MLGKTLSGRYQIISHLGGGGFGTTFIAEDRHLPGTPQCVVKQLTPKTIDHPLALQAAKRLFNREAEVLYQLGNHNQIPRLFAHFEEEQEFYLVQEFIEGHELRQELPVGKKLSENFVIALLKEVLEILAFVHQQNVIHRDIKPSNLVRRKQDGKLVLIDFGAVKQFGTQVINSQGATSFTIAIGSPGYMPNEQIAGKPRFSSDIYAVGMLAIQAFTGLHPRELPEDSNTSEIIWRDRVQASPNLANILDKMVCYDFRQRYQSAAQALQALDGVSSSSFTPTTAISKVSQKLDADLETTKLIVTDNLISEHGVDYTQLQELLAVGAWKRADRIAVIAGDIIQQKVDAIVNATDRSFSGGGGVDYAIHCAAGPELREECLQLNGCRKGEAKITNGYNLLARWVIHTVGPVWQGGNHGEGDILAQCYRNCLNLAEQYSIRTIAFPAISTGTFGFPTNLASRIAVTEVARFLQKNTSVEKIIFSCFGQTVYDCYLVAIQEILDS